MKSSTTNKSKVFQFEILSNKADLAVDPCNFSASLLCIIEIAIVATVDSCKLQEGK